jgi:hypothetical protein
MDPHAESRLERAALIAIVLVGIAVRLMFLDRPMQLDEAYTYNEYASKPVLDGISWYTLPNNHLLNTLLIHVSTALLGNQRWVVRLPALAAGLGVIVATFALVDRLGGRTVALLATALVAASAPQIDYSTNARGYTLVGAIALVLALKAERILSDSRGGRARDWVWFTVLPALGCFAIPIMVYPYGGIVLWMLLVGRRAVRLDRLVFSGVVAVLLAVVLYIPALGRTGLARVTANPYVAPQPLGRVVVELPGSLGLAWRHWNSDLPRALAGLFLLACAAALARFLAGRSGRAAPSGLLLAVLGFSLAAGLLQRVVPYDRVWLFAQPLYAAAVAEGLSWGLDRLRLPLVHRHGGWLPAVLAVLLCLGLSGLVVRGRSLAPGTWLTLHHADAIARDLKPLLGPDDGVAALAPADAPLKYEFLRHQIAADVLYDHRIGRARRLFVALNQPGQSLPEVLAGCKIQASRYSPPRLVRDYGTAALYELRRLPSTAHHRPPWVILAAGVPAESPKKSKSFY